MATKKKGMMTPPPQWWKHLIDWKRIFWKKERKNADREVQKQSDRGASNED